MIVSLLLTVMASQAASPGTPQAPAWSQVAQATRTYEREPSCQHADALIALIPNRELAIPERPGPEVVGLLYGQLTLIQAQLLLGDACAARLGFRLSRVADAAFGEDLAAALGSLATTRPELFLRELARSELSCQAITAYSANYSLSEARNERALRLQRLREVRVPAALQPVRRQCLRALEGSTAP